MKTQIRMRFACRSAELVLLVSATAALTGCDAPAANFHINTVYAHNQERAVGQPIQRQHLQDIATILAASFGTPDEPHVPQLESGALDEVLDQDKLALAAGPVASNEEGRPQGLYREHCAHCHGITGDGQGPTAAFLNPYPRDYRPGLFKFKSTPIGSKPTHDDLKRIVIEGIPGTAMPSFRLLSDPELDALVHYVKYLSIRGELERLLIQEAVLELGEDDRLIDLNARQTDPETYQEQVDLIESYIDEVAQKWAAAETEVTPVPPPPEDLNFLSKVELWDDHYREQILTLYNAEDPQQDQETRMAQVAEQLELEPEAVGDVVALDASVQRGRDLFYGQVANCVKCHGDSALGDGQTTDYDNWTKELEPEKPDALHEYLSLGALEPRNIHPRNLRQGIYRGGRRPIDIYWRIYNGIEGTPMPKALTKPDDAPPEQAGLTTRDLWDLINYVRSLPYETVSKPRGMQPDYQRDRPL